MLSCLMAEIIARFVPLSRTMAKVIDRENSGSRLGRTPTHLSHAHSALNLSVEDEINSGCIDNAVFMFLGPLLLLGAQWLHDCFCQISLCANCS